MRNSLSKITRKKKAIRRASQINFCKMHGLGNDFVVIDAISQKVNIKKIPISQLADRHLGIGFDQLLMIGTSKIADFSCRIFNSDGSEAEQCGNGMRCVARFVLEEKLTRKKSLTLETKAGIIEITIKNNDNIRVAMGVPCFENFHVLDLPTQSRVEFTALSLGNPHVILNVKSVELAPVAELGPMIATHSAFPHGTNVGFLEIIDREHVRLRTFERGVGETFACGSNACAAVVAGIHNDLLAHKVEVKLRYGNLWIEWPEEQQAVIMTGPACKVFDGTFISPK